MVSSEPRGGTTWQDLFTLKFNRVYMGNSMTIRRSKELIAGWGASISAPQLSSPQVDERDSVYSIPCLTEYGTLADYSGCQRVL